MKNLIILLTLNIMLACQSQNINTMEPTVDNKFETFDQLEKIKFKTIIDKNNLVIRGYLFNNNYVEITSVIPVKYYIETIKDSFFLISKSFYSNNNIKSKGLGFNGDGFPIGIWYYFDEEGKLIKETNYDEPYKFTFEDILKFCEKENIRVDKGPILQSTGFHTTIYRDVENGQPWWEIKRLKTPDTLEIIKLDGITGEVLSRTEQEYINN
ncbi:hypothetical protein [Empedobacter tilapiae]